MENSEQYKTIRELLDTYKLEPIVWSPIMRYKSDNTREWVSAFSNYNVILSFNEVRDTLRQCRVYFKNMEDENVSKLLMPTHLVEINPSDTSRKYPWSDIYVLKLPVPYRKYAIEDFDFHHFLGGTWSFQWVGIMTGLVLDQKDIQDPDDKRWMLCQREDQEWLEFVAHISHNTPEGFQTESQRDNALLEQISTLRKPTEEKPKKKGTKKKKGKKKNKGKEKR